MTNDGEEGDAFPIHDHTLRPGEHGDAREAPTPGGSSQGISSADDRSAGAVDRIEEELGLDGEGRPSGT